MDSNYKLSNKEILIELWNIKALARVQELTPEQIDRYETLRKSLYSTHGENFACTVETEIEASTTLAELARLSLLPVRTQEQEERKTSLEYYLFGVINEDTQEHFRTFNWGS